MQSIVTVELKWEGDVVFARRRARQIAGVLGLEPQDQSRLATAVSEIARNAFQYAGGGMVEFLIGQTPEMLMVRITDRGPGIADVAAILDGRYVSHTGMGLGISGARRLTEHFEIISAPGQGTSVVLGRRIPRRSPRAAPMTAVDVAARLDASGLDFGQELQEQNQELMRSLQDARARQAEIERLNRELEETNRGVVALYMELDTRAVDLARSADMKSHILSDISHEVRTPLNAILNITRLLMDRMDGELTSEQEKQVRMIRDSAMTVTDLVTDLLELAPNGGRQDGGPGGGVLARRSLRGLAGDVSTARHVRPGGADIRRSRPSPRGSDRRGEAGPDSQEPHLQCASSSRSAGRSGSRRSGGRAT